MSDIVGMRYNGEKTFLHIRGRNVYMQIISPKYDFSRKELLNNEIIRKYFICDVNLKKDEEYHTVYRLRDERGNDFSDVFELHIIELQKKLKGNDKLDDWIRLLNAESEDDLDMIQTKNAGILEAIKEVRVMSLSKRMRLRYEARLKEMRDQKARENLVRQEGREQKIIEVVRLKLAKGQSVEQIAEALEETPEYIRKIMEEI